MQRLKRDPALLCLTLLVAVCALRHPLGLLLRLLCPEASTVPSSYYACLMVQETLLYGLPALLLAFPLRRLRRPAPRGPLPMAALLCASLGLLLQLLTQALTSVWTSLLTLLAPSLPQSLVPMPRNLAEGLLAFLALAAVPALAEELLFRGAAYPALRSGLGQRRACLLCALSFGLMHGSLTGLPAHLLVGLAATAALLYTRSLLGPVLLHLSYNAGALVLVLCPALSPPSLLPPWSLAVLSALALVLAALLTVRLHQALPGPQRPVSPAARLLLAVLLGALLLGYLPELRLLLS